MNGTALVPAAVAAQVTRVIAGDAERGEAPAVALELLEQIRDEADDAMMRLATGEAPRGTAALSRIRNMARDALRLSSAERAS